MTDLTFAGQGNDAVDNGGVVNKNPCGCESRSLELAIESGNIERVDTLIDRCSNVCEHLTTALQTAADYSNMEMIEFLISKGADVNQQGGRFGGALQVAASSGRFEIVKFLIDKGADVNRQGGVYGSALQAAAAHSYIEIADFLINEGANVNQQGGNRDNALQAAVVHGNLEMIKHLVDKGANVCLQDDFQMTALHYAVWRMEPGIVGFLLGKNARPDAQNDTGVTPFDLAIQLGTMEIILLLLPKMKSAPFLSTRTWRSVLHLESAEAVMFTFGEHLSVEPIEVSDMPSFIIRNEKARYIRYFRFQFDAFRTNDERRELLDSIPKGLVHIVCDNGMSHCVSPSSTFRCRWWRWKSPHSSSSWKPEASLLPSPDLCRQLGSQDFLIESWFAISCLTITDSNWPSQQTPTPEAYNQLNQVEGFFCTIAKRPQNGFTGGSSTEEPLLPIFSATTCGDTPVKLIESIEDLFTPLIEKLGQTYEKNNLEAGRQLSNARLEVLRNGGRNEGLLPRLLSDATIIEYMTENHAHIVRSLTGLIDCVAELQDGPWKLSKQAENVSRERIRRLEAHRETLRELLERSQNIIQLEFNLASILEARRSTSTNRSLKRLTWVTFVFLPLMFVASLFGMNVDILSDNPSWWWYFPVAGGFVLLTFSVWIFFKRFNTLEGSLERYFAWLTGDGIPAEVKQPTINGERRGSNTWADLKKIV
ncbi:ankyrin repeat-containing domain protein [Xylaria curta]|nr:ankyrin repeat-containing domain protein [Xylaria curta]